MKKILIPLALVLVALIGVGAYFALTSMNAIVKAAVEQVGSDVTGTKVVLDDVEISLTDGRGALRGFTMTNPKGFGPGEAFAFDEVSVTLDITTIASDPVVIKEVVIEGPRVTYVLGDGKSNMDQIQDNVDSYDRGKDPAAQEPASAGPNIVIENLYLRNGTVAVTAPRLSDDALSTPLPDIHMTDIGKEGGGATPAEVASQTLEQVIATAGQAVAGLDLGALAEGAEGLAKDAGEALGSGAGEARNRLEGAAEETGKALKKLLN